MPDFPVLHYLLELAKKKKNNRTWNLGWPLGPAQEPSGTAEVEI